MASNTSAFHLGSLMKCIWYVIEIPRPRVGQPAVRSTGLVASVSSQALYKELFILARCVASAGLAGQSALSAGFNQGSFGPPPPKPEVSPWQESGLCSGVGGGEEEANRKLSEL